MNTKHIALKIFSLILILSLTNLNAQNETETGSSQKKAHLPQLIGLLHRNPTETLSQLLKMLESKLTLKQIITTQGFITACSISHHEVIRRRGNRHRQDLATLQFRDESKTSNSIITICNLAQQADIKITTLANLLKEILITKKKPTKQLRILPSAKSFISFTRRTLSPPPIEMTTLTH